MLGSSCSSCCGCSANDGLARTDPVDEGTWVPSGTYPFIAWTFFPYSPETPGNTWFFSGARTAAGLGTGSATDWFNPCNWYSHRTVAPSIEHGQSTDLSFAKRATRLPPQDAVVHIYTDLAVSSPVSVSAAYFWRRNGPQDERGVYTPYNRIRGGTIVATGTVYGANAGFWLQDVGISATVSTVELNGNVALRRATRTLSGNPCVVNGNVDMRDTSELRGTVNGTLEARGSARSGANVNGNARFYDSSQLYSGTVTGTADFYDMSRFTGCPAFGGPSFGQVNGGATFYDDARSCCIIDSGGFKFSAHPTILPTCSGTAPTFAQTTSILNCGCR